MVATLDLYRHLVVYISIKRSSIFVLHIQAPPAVYICTCMSSTFVVNA